MTNKYQRSSQTQNKPSTPAKTAQRPRSWSLRTPADSSSKDTLWGWLDDISEYMSTHNLEESIQHVNELAEQARREPLIPTARITQQVGHRRYDEIIESIFSSVLRATSREDLLDQVLKDLPRNDQSTGACLILDCIQATDDDSRKIIMKLDGILQTGLQSNRWNNFKRQVLSNLGESVYLKNALSGSEELNLWYSFFHPVYAGEFNALVDKQRGYWISTLHLPSLMPDRPDRLLIALYPNAGSEERPRPPGNAVQELRVFHFLRLAYQVLNHQLAGVAEQVLSQRRQLLAELAPGILHHEIGIQMEILRETMQMLVPTIRSIHWRHPSQESEKAGEYLLAIQKGTNRLHDIAHAFNALEKRTPAEEACLQDVVEQVFYLCRHRLGRVGCALLWDENELNLQMVTDPSLLFHLLINVVINATNAIAEHSLNNAGGKVVIQRKPGTERWPICLEIINTGPPIPAELQERIFEKGFSTRQSGHGYGLYICRLIAEFLGGALRTIPQYQLASGYGAGFRLELPVVWQRHDSVHDETRSPLGKGARK